MIKKTLLSIMTIAALVSSATAAVAVTKDIHITANIPYTITVERQNGVYSAPMNLVRGFDSNNPDVYGAAENDSGGRGIKISVVDNFKLRSSIDQSEFTDLKVTLDGVNLDGNAVDIKEGTRELKIIGKAPAGVAYDDVFTGTLTLNVEGTV